MKRVKILGKKWRRERIKHLNFREIFNEIYSKTLPIYIKIKFLITIVFLSGIDGHKKFV